MELESITKSPKRCPVCYFDRTYAGPICPKCSEIGYKMGSHGRPVRSIRAEQKRVCLYLDLDLIDTCRRNSAQKHQGYQPYINEVLRKALGL